MNPENAENLKKASLKRFEPVTSRIRVGMFVLNLMRTPEST